jgi:hypothetical protein
MISSDFPEAGWGWRFFAEACQWLGPIIYFIGLAIALWAFQWCRKCGYLVIAMYFAASVLWLFFSVPIWRAFHSDDLSDIERQTEQRVEAAQRDATDKVLAEAGHPPIHARNNISIPVGPAALVIGVWLLARREKRAS